MRRYTGINFFGAKGMVDPWAGHRNQDLGDSGPALTAHFGVRL